MKEIFSSIIVLLFCLNASAQTDRYKGAAIFNNGVLKEVNDSIHFNIDIDIEDHAIPVRSGLRFVPIIIAGNNTLELPDLMVLGKNKNRNWIRSQRLLSKKQNIAFKEPFQIMVVEDDKTTSFHYTYAAPYELWMDEARLVIYQELINHKDERSIIAMSFDNKVQLSPRIPYVSQPKANFILPAVEVKVRNHQGQAFLDFQSGKTEILPNYRRNPEELAKISQAFNEIASNSDITIKSLFIEGYASPEGRYELNERLARDRAFALKNHIIHSFRLPLDNNNIHVSWIAEDWEGLNALVRAEEIAYKDKILIIIGSNANADTKERSLARLGGGIPYRKMLTELFPQLRRVEYQIDYSVRDFASDEIASKYKADFHLLSQRELYMLAESDAEGVDSEDILLNVIPRLYPNSVTSVVNAAAIMIERGEYISARKILEGYANHPEAWNNLGIIYMMEGDLDRAEELFLNAFENGTVEAEHNLEQTRTKRADNVRMERYSTRKE